MLEEIRRKLITRTVDMVKFADTWICDIAPMSRLMLEESKVGCKVGEGHERYFGMLILGVRLEKGSIGIHST